MTHNILMGAGALIYVCGVVICLIAMGGVTPPRPGHHVETAIDVVAALLWPFTLIVAIYIWRRQRAR